MERLARMTHAREAISLAEGACAPDMLRYDWQRGSITTMKHLLLAIVTINLLLCAWSGRAASAEQFIMCNMERDTLSHGTHQASEYKLGIKLDDAKRTITTDDLHGLFAAVTAYSDLEIKGRMEPFDFVLDREKGSFARAARTAAGAIVESGLCEKIPRPKAKF
jgi:hypothetical protein